MGDVLDLERTAEDRARSVRHILADMRAHEIAGVTLAEIREAIEDEEQEIEMDQDRVRWSGSVVVIGLVLVVLMVLWCRGWI